jgi:hypothetical protein
MIRNESSNTRHRGAAAQIRVILHKWMKTLIGV